MGLQRAPVMCIEVALSALNACIEGLYAQIENATTIRRDTDSEEVESSLTICGRRRSFHRGSPVSAPSM